MAEKPKNESNFDDFDDDFDKNDKASKSDEGGEGSGGIGIPDLKMPDAQRQELEAYLLEVARINFGESVANDLKRNPALLQKAMKDYLEEKNKLDQFGKKSSMTEKLNLAIQAIAFAANINLGQHFTPTPLTQVPRPSGFQGADDREE